MNPCSCNIRHSTNTGICLCNYKCLIRDSTFTNCSPQNIVYARAYRNLLVYNNGNDKLCGINAHKWPVK